MKSSSENARYTGGVTSEGVRNGKGKYRYADSCSPEMFEYEGNWSQGVKCDTQGKFTVAGVSTYVGEFENGEITGFGHRKWEDGKEYEGNFLEGELHGTGIWTYPIKNERYEGEFQYNQRHGMGVLVRKDEIYKGMFVKHKMNGKFDVTIGDDLHFIGAIIDNIVSGAGKLHWNGVAEYIGEFVEGKMEGMGSFRTIQDSYCYNGKFVHGLPMEHDCGAYLWSKLDRSEVIKEEIEDPKKKAPPKKLDSVPVSIVSLTSNDLLGKICVRSGNNNLWTQAQDKALQIQQQAAAGGKGSKNVSVAPLLSIDEVMFEPTDPGEGSLPFELRRRIQVELHRIESGDISTVLANPWGIAQGKISELVLSQPLPWLCRSLSRSENVLSSSRFPLDAIVMNNGRYHRSNPFQPPLALVLETQPFSCTAEAQYSPVLDSDNVLSSKIVANYEGLSAHYFTSLLGSSDLDRLAMNLHLANSNTSSNSKNSSFISSLEDIQNQFTIVIDFAIDIPPLLQAAKDQKKHTLDIFMVEMNMGYGNEDMSSCHEAYRLYLIVPIHLEENHVDYMIDWEVAYWELRRYVNSSLLGQGGPSSAAVSSSTDSFVILGRWRQRRPLDWNHEVWHSLCFSWKKECCRTEKDTGNQEEFFYENCKLWIDGRVRFPLNVDPVERMACCSGDNCNFQDCSYVGKRKLEHFDFLVGAHSFAGWISTVTLWSDKHPFNAEAITSVFNEILSLTPSLDGSFYHTVDRVFIDTICGSGILDANRIQIPKVISEAEAQSGADDYALVEGYYVIILSDDEDTRHCYLNENSIVDEESSSKPWYPADLNDKFKLVRPLRPSSQIIIKLTASL